MRSTGFASVAIQSWRASDLDIPGSAAPLMRRLANCRTVNVRVQFAKPYTREITESSPIRNRVPLVADGGPWAPDPPDGRDPTRFDPERHGQPGMQLDKPVSWADRQRADHLPARDNYVVFVLSTIGDQIEVLSTYFRTQPIVWLDTTLLCSTLPTASGSGSWDAGRPRSSIDTLGSGVLSG